MYIYHLWTRVDARCTLSCVTRVPFESLCIQPCSIPSLCPLSTEGRLPFLSTPSSSDVSVAVSDNILKHGSITRGGITQYQVLYYHLFRQERHSISHLPRNLHTCFDSEENGFPLRSSRSVNAAQDLRTTRHQDGYWYEI